MNLPTKPSESFKRRNPHLYGLGKLDASQPKQVAVETLVSGGKKRQVRKSGVVIIVTLLALRRRILDDDNAVAACKPLRDAIADSLGIDDGDSRIRWEYGQQQTTGSQGVIVKIEGVS